jgi:hypothetical protein
MTDLSITEAPEPKAKPYRVVLATKHLVKQRAKAIAARDKAAGEVKELDAALLALGWPSEE